ncbi:E3 ubiquitin/ISG15 ligase TRIM25-like [Astyanax mexicanus]|uniref:E3 ubiquitin/ISG15 ligase TRIM25-like n=1 Tax=Astyanax mexicanus TaxID=7994 RepID=UPI0020CB0311|nr:E3 ubiquitin/ISG15 ligase TRIM25-like [Astyanax mexicanus]
MAEFSISVVQDEFSCSVCLDLLKNPVTIPCGHSFCMVCINKCWDEEDQKKIYSCPHCRHTFTSRPVVSKNTMLAEVVEKLKKTRLQAAPPDHSSADPEDVECDFCTGRKHKAVQSCLVCLASFCEAHLQPHYQSPAFKKHKLVKASRRLQEQICSQHDKLLEVYCRTDQQCICMLCMLDDHKAHYTVSLAAEISEKQKQVVETQRKYKERIQQREKELQELTEAVENHKRSAQTAVKDSEKIFTEMILSIESIRSEVRQMIRDQEKAAVSRAEERLKRLKQEITELKRRDADLEKLSFTEDHIHFLQVTNTKFILDCLHHLLKEVQIILPPEPKSREDFLQYSCQLTLHPNTAHKLLLLSERNTVVTRSKTVQPYPDHPDRFDEWPQVLCRESLLKQRSHSPVYEQFVWQFGRCSARPDGRCSYTQLLMNSAELRQWEDFTAF